MADVLLFHHAQGLTTGCLDIVARLRDAGHTVHAPDLYDGTTFATLTDGIQHAQDVDVARQLADTLDTAELFLYPGDQHLFTDNSLPSYDPEAADQALTRLLSFLDTLDAR